jgi:hypothetical protein
MKLHAQDARRSAGAFAVLAAAAGLTLTGCHNSSAPGSTTATANPGTGSASSTASSPASSTASSPASSAAVTASGSLPFPTTVGDTWSYNNSNGSTSENKITSSTQVATGQQITMATAFKDNGTTTHLDYDYIVQPNGQISLPTNEFTSGMASSGVSVKLLSGGVYWPSAAALSGGQAVHSTLVMEMTIEGKTDKITEYITSTGEGNQTVTVPAGTFTATVVNVAESTKFMGISTTIYDKSWLAPGVGPVQSELIDVEGGKTEITNKEVLTSFVKG